MSAVTVTGSNNNSNSNSKTTQRSGNFGSFKNTKSLTEGLTAKGTFGEEFKVPDYTIKQLLDSIPQECYERKLSTSFYYVFRDIFLILSIGLIFNYLIPLYTPSNYLIRSISWTLYSALLSLPFTGIWVLAHECGHQAFSSIGWINDTVGWILHSFLMVPYFSWKYSHGKHHKSTGNLSKDMVFVPKTKNEFKISRNLSLSQKLDELTEDTPINTLISLLIQQFGGWWAYLATNVTGQKYIEYENKSKFLVSHFNPNSPIFEKRDYWFVILSDIGLLIQSILIYQFYLKFGLFSMFINWFLPYVFCNHWLVFITYLQHTDPNLPHYESHEWNFARGAAATIDREFGFIGWFFFHDIIETHVLHHYCSRLPFYNARLATENIKKVMGDHYKHSDENMWVSLWQSSRACQFVDGDNGVLMYRNINGLGLKPTN
ncbi:hypothetical protein CANARDRAFT_175200 [[Candida] arabinofermentans NRRL YB-2248]|uniref:Fatty acid desaturase domain-containing protein n=1 Tax=[Candida] arabinofermentans NRRL YB-2248 TaxID=983967 RepID=A0A1E4T3E7_9ASCO|nr:hypothetical protein CANARDRAFT_175200 [[Candida] arabinofermentans NRRL YB-2248]